MNSNLLRIVSQGMKILNYVKGSNVDNKHWILRGTKDNKGSFHKVRVDSTISVPGMGITVDILK